MTTTLTEVGGLGGGLRTAGSIRTKITQVNAEVAAFTADVARSTAPEPWKASYALWLQAWSTFAVETMDSWWAQQWGDTYTQAERFEMRLADWRAAFATMGGSATAPPPRPEQLEGTDWGSVLIWTGVLAAVGAGLWFGWPLIAARFASSRSAGVAGLTDDSEEEDCGCGG